VSSVRIRHLSLDYFNLSPEQKYHIYRINSSQTSQSPHSHDFYQICYVDKGEIQHWQNDTPVRLIYGDAFIVPPNFVHRIVFPDPDAFIYSISFSENMFHPGFSYSSAYQFMTALKIDTINEKHIDIRMKVVLDENQRFIMKSLCESLIKESKAECPAQLSASASLIDAIMCILSQAYANNNSPGNSLNNLSQYSISMQKCLEYIDNHFMMPLKADELAHRFAMSKSTFGVLFHQFIGMPPKQYITQRRIDYATMLASNANFSMKEISQMVGYEYFSTFYRNFTKITGISPSEYRSKWKDEADKPMSSQEESRQ